MIMSPKLASSCAACLLAVGCAVQASAADSFVPANIFTPKSNLPSSPTFTGRENVAKSIDVFVGSHGETPDVNEIKSIPTLTDDQRKQIDELYKQSNTAMQPLREEMSALDRVAMPSDAATAFDGTEVGSPESINAHIDSLKRQIANENVQLWDRTSTVVRPDQLNDLLAMRHGRLLIASEARTDLPDPTPKPKPPQPQAAKPRPNNFWANHGHPIFPSAPPPVKTILMNTTRSLLYRALWSIR